jgi:hypothetical protein
MAGNGNAPGLGSMLELPMRAFGLDLVPAVLLDAANRVTNLCGHGEMVPRARRRGCVRCDPGWVRSRRCTRVNAAREGMLTAVVLTEREFCRLTTWRSAAREARPLLRRVRRARGTRTRVLRTQNLAALLWQRLTGHERKRCGVANRLDGEIDIEFLPVEMIRTGIGNVGDLGHRCIAKPRKG